MPSGQIANNPEQPKRIEVLSQGAINAGCTLDAPKDFGMGPIGEIHSLGFLRLLQTAVTRWLKTGNGSGEVVPSIHPLSRNDSYPKSTIGQAGFH